MTKGQNNSEKVPFLTKLAYGMGDTGTAAAASIRSFFFLYFLTDVAGLNPVLAGAVLMVNKLWDAVNDPLIGSLSDHLPTRWGRRRPWFLLGALPFALTFFFLYRVPALSQWGKFAYYLVASFLFDLAYTAVNVPYAALAPELTSDYHERTVLNKYRFAVSIIVGLLAALLHQQIVGAVQRSGGLEAKGYMFSTIFWGSISILTFVFAFAGTYERYHPEKPKRFKVFSGFLATWQNQGFRLLAGVHMLSWMAVQIVSSIIVYYMKYWLKRPELTSLILLAVQGSALLWLFLWTILSRRLGKKAIFQWGAGTWVIASVVLFLVQPDWPSWVAMGVALAAGAGVSVAYFMPYAMLPDLIEQDELVTGERREGIYYGFFVFLQKASLALGLFLVGWALDLTGYIKPEPGITAPLTQPASALFALRLMIGPLPAVLLLTSMLLVKSFPITQAKHEQNLRELEQRRAEREAAVGVR